MYEGAELGPPRTLKYPIFTMVMQSTAQFFLEVFQWDGVKPGDAFAFYAGDIRVEERTRSARAFK
jgi:hypothetical protein